MRKITVLAAIMAVVLAAAAPALARSRSGNDSAKGNPGKGDSGHNKEYAGLVDIGGGRKKYMECQGKGSPTVVFVAGVGDRAETWSKTLDRSKQAVCLRSPKPTGYAPTIVQGLLS